MKPKIVFMGSPDFSVPTLIRLTEVYDVIGVVTQPDRPAGRGKKLIPPPVKIAAEARNIPIMQPHRLRKPEEKEQLIRWNPDLIVVVAFGQILRQDVLDLPRHGCINVHASLLPRWRGAAPIQSAILHGDCETGVTIMRMDAGIDTGPVLSKAEMDILPGDTAETLSTQLSLLGAELLVKTLPGYLAGEIPPIPQKDENATYAPMLKKEDGLLDFSNKAVELERKIRAFYPWPGAFFEINGARIKALEAEVSLEAPAALNQRIVIDKYPAVGTSEGVVIFKTLQPAGKRPMDGKIFLNGFRDW